ncbi:MAG: hypothetical protein SGBAC_003854 [Bacillariaceae sp.]
MGLSVKPAIAVGAAFAPSSLGVASNALSTGDVLNTPIGQTIVASSVFDDVLGLILLSILEVFAAPDPSVFQYVLPFISSFGYLIVLGMLGITVFPRVIENRILPLVSESNRDQLAMARTPVHWNLQEDFKRALERDGLIIIDHRSWHTLGRKDIAQEAVDITELFAQDTKQRVRITGCFPSQASTSDDSSSIGSDFDRQKSSTHTSDGDTFAMNFSPGDDAYIANRKEKIMIDDRCEAIKQVMADCLKSDSPDDYRIQVSQWEPFIVDGKPHNQEVEPEEAPPQQAARRRFYTFSSFQDGENVSNEDPFDTIASAPSNDGSVVQENTKPKRLSLNLAPRRPSIIGRSVSAMDTPTAAADGPLLSSADLWEKDEACHRATRHGFTLSPEEHGYGGRNVTIGLGEAASTQTTGVPRARHRRAVSYDPGLVSQHLQEDVENFVIKDRLHGYVRHHQVQGNTQASQELTTTRLRRANTLDFQDGP